MYSYLLNQDEDIISYGPVALLQEQQDRAVIPGAELTFEGIRFQFDLSNYECYEIAYVCVGISTQEGVEFELQGVTESGDDDVDVLLACSPHLECRGKMYFFYSLWH